MKKNILFLILCPLILMAEVVVIPDNVTDTIESTVSSFISNTFFLSSTVMAIIQALKKLFSVFQLEISGIKSQVLAILLNTVYVLLFMNVWEDGVITSTDINLMIQGIISSIGGIYGYKVLWRKPQEIEEKQDVRSN